MLLSSPSTWSLSVAAGSALLLFLGLSFAVWAAWLVFV
jgi:hypothetical protein